VLPLSVAPLVPEFMLPGLPLVEPVPAPPLGVVEPGLPPELLPGLTVPDGEGLPALGVVEGCPLGGVAGLPVPPVPPLWA
jgi:hypothetical protein